MARASAGLQSHEKMLVPSVHPLLWLFVLFPGTTASANSSIHAVTAQSQSTTHSPDVKNHTSESQEKSRQELAYEFRAGDPPFLAESLSKEPSVKPTPPAHPNATSVGPATTAKSSPVATTLLASTVQDETSNGSRTTPAPPPQGQEPKTSKNTTTSAAQGTSAPITPTTVLSGYLPTPTPTDDKSPLTVAAFGVISFIVILIVVVIILVSVVSLRFKCNRSKDSEDKQKPGTSVVSESCSAGTSQKKNSITLISMKNINTNNSRSHPPSEKVL